jgi:hypothetical protein
LSDAYPSSRDADKMSVNNKEKHHASGDNWLHGEKWVTENFAKVVVLRLPGFLWPGLKMKVNFVLMHDIGL